MIILLSFCFANYTIINETVQYACRGMLPRPRLYLRLIILTLWRLEMQRNLVLVLPLLFLGLVSARPEAHQQSMTTSSGLPMKEVSKELGLDGALISVCLTSANSSDQSAGCCFNGCCNGCGCSNCGYACALYSLPYYCCVDSSCCCYSSYGPCNVVPQCQTNGCSLNQAKETEYPKAVEGVKEAEKAHCAAQEPEPKSGCAGLYQPCSTTSDCCIDLCSPTSCSNGICIGSTCLGRGSACQADCSCCSQDCVVSDTSPGFCN